MFLPLTWRRERPRVSSFSAGALSIGTGMRTARGLAINPETSPAISAPHHA